MKASDEAGDLQEAFVRPDARRLLAGPGYVTFDEGQHLAVFIVDAEELWRGLEALILEKTQYAVDEGRVRTKRTPHGVANAHDGVDVAAR